MGGCINQTLSMHIRLLGYVVLFCVTVSPPPRHYSKYLVEFCRDFILRLHCENGLTQIYYAVFNDCAREFCFFSVTAMTGVLNASPTSPFVAYVI